MLLCCTLSAQPERKFEFDVVSVKPANPDPRGYTVGCKGGPGTDDPVTFRCTNMSFTNLLARAFQVRYDQVQGPDWLKSQMFEINARVPANTNADQFRAMLQSMLIDRFQLKVHREKKEMTVFALVVAKGGPKFKEHADESKTSEGSYGDAPAPSGLSVDKDGYPDVGKAGMAFTRGKGAWAAQKAQIGALAGMITGQVGRTVNDETGLKGEYDFKLHWMSESLARQDENGITIMQALQDQLGLRLESRKGTEEFLVVDHIEKVPTDN
jgi:uncharacterized protein (TIGR03435 family)